MIRKFFPFLGWFEEYDLGKFKIDFIAGLTVALVLIPQSMAYAQLAGLPAYYGLYAAFLPPMVAALFGSSRQLATGPVAIVSLMNAASLEPLATAGSAGFIAYSIVLALTVGIFQLLLGVLRLGLVVNFLSHPVVNGFTNAGAIIIATSQLSKFFGVYVDAAHHNYETLVRVCQAALDYTHIPTLIFGVSAVIIMAGLKKINPRIPNVLVAVALTTIVSWLIGFNNDAHISLSNIQSPAAVEKIIEFNRVIGQHQELVEQRKNATLRVDEIHQKEHIKLDEEILRQLNIVNVANYKIDVLKEQEHKLRKELRTMKFSEILQNDKQIFYEQGQVPDGIATDKTTWRIKVGNNQLDTENILITGGGAVVGSIPKGLPQFTMPHLTIHTFFQLLPTAVIISLLGFMEAVAIAKAMASKSGQKLDPNQELIGQGLANILGSFTSSYSVSGSFSRSAVNFQAGAVSGISSVVTSIVVVATLLFFTPLLYHLPQAVLAAVIMMAVIGLVNIRGFMHAWTAQWYDGAISIITFVVTLYFAPHLDKGIELGVVLSLLVFFYKAMRPTVVTLSMNAENVLGASEYYRLQGCQHISVIRFDGPLFFTNASYLDEQVTRYRTDLPNLRYILLDARGINDMDASGEEALRMLCERVRSGHLGFAICGAKFQMLKVMERTGLLDVVGKEWMYPDSKAAVLALTKKVHEDSSVPLEACVNCPLQKYVPKPEEEPKKKKGLATKLKSGA